jgi:hypothetical protein
MKRCRLIPISRLDMTWIAKAPRHGLDHRLYRSGTSPIHALTRLD